MQIHCHPERSEGPVALGSEMHRSAQQDRAMTRPGSRCMFFHPQCRNPKIFYCLLDVTNTYSSTFYTIDTWRIYSHIFGKDAQALGVYVDRGIEAREEQDMSQCLRCNKPCEATFVFCDNCQSLLRSQLGQVADTFEEETITFSPLVALSPEHAETV